MKKTRLPFAVLVRSLWRGLAALAVRWSAGFQPALTARDHPSVLGPVQNWRSACLRSAGFPPALFALLLAFTFTAQAAPPVVSNIRVAQRAGTHLVDLYYHVADADGDNLTVYVAVSDNGGASYDVPVFTLTGAVGPGVTPGNDRHITWNAGTDWAGQFSSQCRVKITADDGTAPPAPAGMALVPAGPFQMGDSFGFLATFSGWE